MLTIIVPSYNEQERILPTLAGLTRELHKRRAPYSILIIDESKDATPALVKRYAVSKDRNVKFVHFRNRLGKGGAVIEGLKMAKGDVVLYDADAATPPSQIPKLLGALNTSQLALGSRYLPASRTKGITTFRRFASRMFNLLVRLMFGLDFADTQCGFKAIRSDVVRTLAAQPYQSKGWEWDLELVYRAKRKLGLSVVEVPIEWHHVPGGPLESGSVLGVGLKMFRGLLKLRSSL